MTTRPTWDKFFLDVASAVSSRATCVRRKHGAVVAKDNRIVSTGYNGAPPGYPHCEDGFCPRAQTDVPSGSDYSNCIANHAEANALLWSSPDERAGATIYITGAPCFGCAKLIASSGIKQVVYANHEYDDWQHTKKFLQDCHVRVRRG